MIYLDHNATTPLHAQVLEAMMPYMTRHYGNPSSLYRMGRIARSAIDNAREQVAALVGASAKQVTFTSSGTEANNLAIHNLLIEGRTHTIAVGATEHPSVQTPLKYRARSGHTLRTLPVNQDGDIQIAQLQEWLAAGELDALSLMWANNETGVVHTIDQLSAVLAEYPLRWHCDAVQAAGKIHIRFQQTAIQFMSLSAHKIYGPKGIGALISDGSIPVHPLLQGGGQENDTRSGTENVAAIVGFGKAAELAAETLVQRQQHNRQLRERLESGLSALPSVTIFAQNSQRLPNTTQMGLNGIDGEMLLMELDRQGIAVSSGSACSSNHHAPSPVLLAMGVSAESARSAIRISLGSDNTEAEIDAFLSKLKQISAMLTP